MTRARSRELLEQLRLEDEAESTAATLPYGAQRRVALARTLAMDPRYLPQTASEVQRGIQYSSDPIIRLFASIRAPTPSYRLSPVVLAVLLFAVALAALLAAGTLARPLYALVRRKEIDGGPELTPLERALAAVDAATRRQPGSAEHREALAWLGRELRRTNLTDLVGRARRLAWSEQPPTAHDSRELAADVEAGQRDGS